MNKGLFRLTRSGLLLAAGMLAACVSPHAAGARVGSASAGVPAYEVRLSCDRPPEETTRIAAREMVRFGFQLEQQSTGLVRGMLKERDYVEEARIDAARGRVSFPGEGPTVQRVLELTVRVRNGEILVQPALAVCVIERRVACHDRTGYSPHENYVVDRLVSDLSCAGPTSSF